MLHLGLAGPVRLLGHCRANVSDAIAELEALMTRVPAWWPGSPIAAEIKALDRYAKQPARGRTLPETSTAETSNRSMAGSNIFLLAQLVDIHRRAVR